MAASSALLPSSSNSLKCDDPVLDIKKLSPIDIASSGERYILVAFDGTGALRIYCSFTASG